MKISCQSCGAKYNIADDKVRGKIVKIACKKCGARIEIDGRDQAGAAAELAHAHAHDEAEGGATGDPGAMWTVSVDDNDQREVTTAQLAELVHAGSINVETYVWREGMGDWAMIKDIPDLANLGASSGPGMAAAPAPAAASREPASAARLGSAARRGGAVDLFAASAGGAAEDEDVATSAPQPGFAMAASANPSQGGKPIGARNENSVLFSLAALTATGPSTATAAPADDEKSGLIDIQKLAASAKSGGGDNRAKLDDIMNLGGGGAFGASLGAPILAPPPDAALMAPGGDSGGNRKAPMGLIFGGVGVIALLVVLLAVVVIRGNKSDEPSSKSSKSEKAEKSSKSGDDDDKPSKKDDDDKVKDKDKASDKGSDDGKDKVAAPAPTTSGAAASSTGGAKVAIAAPPGTPPGPGTPPAAPTKAGDSPTPPPPGPTPGKPCKSLDDCMGPSAAAKPAPAPAPAATGGEIDKGAAKAALSGVGYKDCGSGGGGKVTVTFGPNGNVTGAYVSAGEYDAGTKSCIAGRFRGAKVPAYGGAPKTFAWSINL